MTAKLLCNVSGNVGDAVRVETVSEGCDYLGEVLYCTYTDQVNNTSPLDPRVAHLLNHVLSWNILGS